MGGKGEKERSFKRGVGGKRCGGKGVLVVKRGVGGKGVWVVRGVGRKEKRVEKGCRWKRSMLITRYGGGKELWGECGRGRERGERLEGEKRKQSPLGQRCVHKNCLG